MASISLKNGSFYYNFDSDYSKLICSSRSSYGISHDFFVGRFPFKFVIIENVSPFCSMETWDSTFPVLISFRM